MSLATVTSPFEALKNCVITDPKQVGYHMKEQRFVFISKTACSKDLEGISIDLLTILDKIAMLAINFKIQDSDREIIVPLINNFDIKLLDNDNLKKLFIMLTSFLSSRNKKDSVKMNVIAREELKPLTLFLSRESNLIKFIAGRIDIYKESSIIKFNLDDLCALDDIAEFTDNLKVELKDFYCSSRTIYETQNLVEKFYNEQNLAIQKLGIFPPKEHGKLGNLIASYASRSFFLCEIIKGYINKYISAMRIMEEDEERAQTYTVLNTFVQRKPISVNLVMNMLFTNNLMTDNFVTEIAQSTHIWSRGPAFVKRSISIISPLVDLRQSCDHKTMLQDDLKKIRKSCQ